MSFFNESLREKVYWFNSYLFTNFQRNRAVRFFNVISDVAIDLFSFKHHIFPLFESNHWFLAIAEISNKKLNGTSCPDEININSILWGKGAP